MHEVTREQFFSLLNDMDVHPYPVGEPCRLAGYTSHWKTRSGELVGKSNGGGKELIPWMAPRRYWLCDRLFSKL
jgi:hypothetical protein